MSRHSANPEKGAAGVSPVSSSRQSPRRIPDAHAECELDAGHTGAHDFPETWPDGPQCPDCAHSDCEAVQEAEAALQRELAAPAAQEGPLADAGDLDTLQREVGAWSTRTFPAKTSARILAHLRRELVELEETLAPEEAADCGLLLLDLADLQGFSLATELRRKHAVNLQRRWRAPDAEGVCEHVPN